VDVLVHSRHLEDTGGMEHQAHGSTMRAVDHEQNVVGMAHVVAATSVSRRNAPSTDRRTNR